MRELKSADDVYETFGAMMRFIAESASCEPWLRQVDEVWRFSITDREAQVTCAFPASGPLRVEFGSSQLTPDTVIAMTASDANAYLLGELNPFLERDQGTLSIEGSPIGFLRTIPRIRGVLASIYRQTAQADNFPRRLLDARGERTASHWEQAPGQERDLR